MPDTLERFRVELEIRIRPCRAEDLRALEWYGLYTQHRGIIEEAFERHLRGENPMLVADLLGFPIGQVWIDLTRKAQLSVGVLWAVRVYPFLQRLGVGARLVRAAEATLRAREFRYAEVGVEKELPMARPLYERLGYLPVGEETDTLSYVDADGTTCTKTTAQWLMRKDLLADANAAE